MLLRGLCFKLNFINYYSPEYLLFAYCTSFALCHTYLKHFEMGAKIKGFQGLEIASLLPTPMTRVGVAIMSHNSNQLS